VRTDPIADLLTRIRNASSAGLRYTNIPGSRIKVEMVRLLREQGFISDFRLIRDGKQGRIKVALKYTEAGKPAIRGLVRVSKSGCRVYSGVDGLKGRDTDVSIKIVTTSKGVMTHTQARESCVGGEVLAMVW